EHQHHVPAHLLAGEADRASGRERATGRVGRVIDHRLAGRREPVDRPDPHPLDPRPGAACSRLGRVDGLGHRLGREQGPGICAAWIGHSEPLPCQFSVILLPLRVIVPPALPTILPEPSMLMSVPLIPTLPPFITIVAPPAFSSMVSASMTIDAAFRV